MKDIYAIQILGDNSDLLSINLKNLLKCVKGGNYEWSILWLEAIGEVKKKGMLDFENEVRKSENGFLIGWSDLLEISEGIHQIIDIVLIGSKQPDNLKRYDDEEEMYSECDFTIELIDSSYWIVHTNDIDSINCMKNELKGVINLEE